VSRLRPYTTSDPSSEEARLVRLIPSPPPMSSAQAARCKERVSDLARAPRVTPKPWPAFTAIGAVVAVAIAGGSLVVNRTTASTAPSEAAEVQTLPPPVAEPRAPEQSEAVHSVSIESLPSVGLPAARVPKREAVPAAPLAVTPSRAEAPESEGGADALTRELRLVDGARVELAVRPSHAYDLLVRHAAEFPGGQLASEREVLLVDALIRTGRRAEAEARARALGAREPGSPYAQRVDALLSSAASKSERK